MYADNKAYRTDKQLHMVRYPTASHRGINLQLLTSNACTLHISHSPCEGMDKVCEEGGGWWMFEWRYIEVCIGGGNRDRNIKGIRIWVGTPYSRVASQTR